MSLDCHRPLPPRAACRFGSRLLWNLAVLSLPAVLILPGVAVAQIPPDVVRRGKQAVALVSLPSGQGFASAFCIDRSGYFLTNYHVVDTLHGEQLTLILEPGGKRERIVSAAVVRTDAEQDLALLRTAVTDGLTALPLASQTELAETQQVVAFGYPFGTKLRVKEQEFPQVSISVGRITALRRSSGRLQRIQIDAEVNRGNSGGPLVDASGEVIGVVNAKISGSSVNFAVPISSVTKLLAEPIIRFAPGRIEHQDRYAEQTFDIQVTSFQQPRPEFDVTIKLGDGEDARDIELQPQPGGRFVGRGAVLRPGGPPSRLPVEIAVSKGSIRGEVEDAAITAGKAGSRLSRLRRIERDGDGWRLVGVDGQQEQRGKLKLKKLTVHIGAASFDLDLDDVRRITINLPPERGVVPFQVIAAAGGVRRAVRDGAFIIAGPPREQAAADARWDALNGSTPWPSYLETPPVGAARQGLRGLGRRYVRTGSGRFLTEDFTFEVVFSIGRDDSIAFIGLGEGRGSGSYSEPGGSVNFRIHSPSQGRGEVVLSKAGPFGGQGVGRIPDAGTHRATISKRGNAVTFAIDVDNDGPSADDLEQTVPNIRDFAPFMHEKNVHLFFGGGGTFQQVRLLADSRPAPKSDSDRSAGGSGVKPAPAAGPLSRFTDEAAEQLDLATATVGKEGLVVKPRSVVRTKAGDLLDHDFRFELVLTVPAQSSRQPLDRPIFVGLGEGRFNRLHELDDSVRLRINPPGHFQGDGGIGLGVYRRAEQSLGALRETGTHRVIVAKRGKAVTFTVDIDNDGETDDDLQSTIPNIRDFAPFLHGKNARLFFGGDARFKSFSLQVAE